ncbi:NifB/NifX family molybdenum-iron cluster-binding protein [Methanothermobacter thermautotrophicus]|uniref:NifB/NifX family molybdenum-iron cluster-binding protein n=1 Tax=Methanothermobacter thermautotrophicus TaxID=145262 RepID=UPI003D7FC9C9
MKICIPVTEERGMDSEVSEHFGKTPLFAFYDDEINELEIMKIDGRHSGGGLTPAEIAVNSDADILICANIGSKAINLLRTHGVDVLMGARGTVAETLNMLKRGELTGATNPCNGRH